MSIFVVGIENGKLKASGLKDQFDLDKVDAMAKAIVAANTGEMSILRSSSLDFPEESGGEKDVNYGDLISIEISKLLA